MHFFQSTELMGNPPTYLTSMPAPQKSQDSTGPRLHFPGGNCKYMSVRPQDWKVGTQVSLQDVRLGRWIGVDKVKGALFFTKLPLPKTSLH